jgi:polysaccharide export outer membrane protein
MRNAHAAAVVMTAMVSFIGCSHQDFTRPAVHNPLTDLLDSRKPYVETEDRPERTRAKRFAEAQAARQDAARAEEGGYRIGPNDVLSVSVFALEEPTRTTTLERTVSGRGQIALPWIQTVTAQGLTPRELESRIRAAYAGQYLTDPQVTVTVAERRSAAVTVAGAVQEPGVYHLERNRSTALEVLALAGGLSEDAGDLMLVQRRKRTADPVAEPSVMRIDLKQLIDEGDLTLNVPVGHGDIVTVPPRHKVFVYVLGYVRRPGAYELKDGMRIDALRVIALGGGLSPEARAANSVLIRETETGHEIVDLDLIKIAKGIRPPVYMGSGDTLVVGSSLGARFSEYLRPRANVGASAGF